MSIYKKACERLKDVVTTVVKPKLGPRLAKQLVDLHPVIPTFYSVVKTHKLQGVQDLEHLHAEEIKTRPIISSCGGPADRLSWLLVKLLSPLLQFVGAHIVNAESFLASLLQCDLSKATTYASLDVVSLYTNVDNRSAVDAVICSYERNQSQITTMGFSGEDVKIMLEAVLACNMFSFDKQLLIQKRGLAMGNRIAPLLAIIYLDCIERVTISSDVLLYKRYVDDVLMIGTTRAGINEIQERLNSFNENIKFTVEVPGKDGFLPFLNTKLKIENGQLSYLWYKKPASANILIHARSAHPLYMKENVVKSLLKTKQRLCNKRDPEVDRTVARILEDNGYSCEPSTSWRPYYATDGISLVLPYVGEDAARKVNSFVKKSELPIRLVFRPPTTLRDMLTSTRIYESKCSESNCRYCRTEKICQIRGAVYQIECSGCGETYIGESGRPLKLRLDEHRRALENPASYPNEAFSKHRTLRHTVERPPSLSVKILHRHLMNVLERKVMEAMEIKRRRPEINNKEEMRDCLRLIS